MNFKINKRRRRSLEILAQKAGALPGSLNPTSGPQKVEGILSEFDAKSSATISIQNASFEVSDTLNSWVDFLGIPDTAILERLRDEFLVDTLILEDVANPTQLPKCDAIGEAIFFTLKGITYFESELHFEQISLILTSQCLVSVQEDPRGDFFDSIKTRLSKNKGKLREKGLDYLIYSLIDSVVDHYFVALRCFDAELETLGDAIRDDLNPDLLLDIHRLKRQIFTLRRYLWYSRDMLQARKKIEHPLLDPSIEKYFNDVGDHIHHAVDICESLRDEILDLNEQYINAVNYKANEIMKQLTIVASIFMPLTLIAGIYGMNFKYMPELEFVYGYPILLGALLVLGIGAWVFFKRRKWL